MGLCACDEVSWKNRGRRSEGYTWQWDKEVMEAISRKEDAHMAMCRNGTFGNKNRYVSMKQKTKKAVSE